MCFFFHGLRPAPRSTLFPYTTLFRSQVLDVDDDRDRFRKRLRECQAHHGLRRFTAEISQDDGIARPRVRIRSEEHTSELQSPDHLVCRLLLEKKKQV